LSNKKQQISINGGLTWEDTGVTRKGSTLIQADDPDCIAIGMWQSELGAAGETPTSNTGFTIVDYGHAEGETNLVYNFKITGAGTDLSYSRSDKTYKGGLKHADYLDLTNMTSLDGFFASQRKLETVDVSRWDVHNIGDFGGMFNDTGNLTEIDLSNWNMASATNINNWLGSGKLTVHIPNSCTSNLLVSADYAFGGKWLTNAELNKLLNWDLSHIINATGMFGGVNVVGDISGITRNLNFRNLKYCDNMLSGLPNVTKMDITGWVFNFPSYFTFSDFCSDNTSLNEFIMDGVDWSSTVGYSKTFANCSNLTKISMKGAKLKETTGVSDFFAGCNKLATIDCTGCDAGTIITIQRACTNASINVEIIS